MERVKTPRIYFLLLCLMPALLIGASSPWEAWTAIIKLAKTPRILNACSPLRDKLRVCLVAYGDHLEGLDHQFSTFPVLS